MSWKFRPTTLVYSALATDDVEARSSKGGIRTSGLQIPGLPRPGKTTQGQDSRRSSEPKKSFRTIRNFWRQLEGGQEPTVRRPFGRKAAPQKVEEKPERISIRVEDRKSQRKPSSIRRRSRASTHVERATAGKISQNAPITLEDELHLSRRTSQQAPSIRKEVASTDRTSQQAPSIREEVTSTGRTSQQAPSIREEGVTSTGRTSQLTPSIHDQMPFRASLRSRGEGDFALGRTSQLSSGTQEERTTRRVSQRPPSTQEETRRSSARSMHHLPSIPEEDVPQSSFRQSSRRSGEHADTVIEIPPGPFDVPSDEAAEEEEEEGTEISFDEADEMAEEEHVRKSSRARTLPGEQSPFEARTSGVSRTSRHTLDNMEQLRATGSIEMPKTKSLELQGSVRSGVSYLSRTSPMSTRISVPQDDRQASRVLSAQSKRDSGEVQDMEARLEDETEEIRSSGLSTPALLPPPPPPLPPTTFLKPPSFWRTPREDAAAPKRPSIMLPILLDEEKHFHEMIASGDVMAVQDFLEKRPNFNINCSNYQGISALMIAVKAGNEEMTLFLLAQPYLDIGDAHLYAIRDNQAIILRMILDTFQSINPSLEFMACANSAEFAENVTPLILAAQSGHYEIIGILLGRGHTIPIPHPPRCFCKEECQVLLRTEDPLAVASGKLHIYRALCNPAYICQTSDDPILTAFRLSKELLQCGHVEQTYMRQYEDLAEATRNFAVDIIAEARSSEEVETILSNSKGVDLKGSYIFPRLIMAMDYKQKEFVSHPNIQQVLEKTWLGDWVAWKGYRKYIRALYFLPRIVMLPGILVILMFMPTSSWARYYALPINKLLSNVASYAVFLILVFIQSNVDKKNQTRDTKPTGVEVFLAIYVIAFLYNSIRSLIIEGRRRFFGFMWNLYELFMELLFVLTFIFWITAAIKTTVTGTKDVERKYWHYMDPELIAEGLFVIAAIMAYMKILLICQMSYDLGPLQVSLGKMTNDCAIFSVILGIIILAFTVGLCRFYSYYEGMEQKNPDTGEVDSKQENSFTSFHETFKILFWGLFGMPSYEVADVVLDNINDESGKPTIINEHHFTESIGYIVFAIYMTLTVIVILNMLIATMSNTFQKVTDNVDMEWAFGRTEVKLAYMNMPVMPPPFNLIPTTRGLVDVFKGAKAKAGEITGIGVDVEKGLIEEEKKVEEFSVLMSQLVQRYFSTKSEMDV